MTFDWERMVAVMLALSPDLKLDYARIADMYGSGISRHGMEHRLRKPRKMAAEIISKHPCENEVIDTSAGIDSKKKKRKASAIAEDVIKPASARKRTTAARRLSARKASITPKDDAAMIHNDLAAKGNQTEDSDETESMPLTEEEEGESFVATDSTSES